MAESTHDGHVDTVVGLVLGQGFLQLAVEDRTVGLLAGFGENVCRVLQHGFGLCAPLAHMDQMAGNILEQVGGGDHRQGLLAGIAAIVGEHHPARRREFLVDHQDRLVQGPDHGLQVGAHAGFVPLVAFAPQAQHQNPELLFHFHQGFVEVAVALPDFRVGASGGANSVPGALEHELALLQHQAVALLLDLGQFGKQFLPTAQADAARQVRHDRRGRMLDIVQQFERGADPVRHPGGVIANGGRVGRAVDTGDDRIAGVTH